MGSVKRLAQGSGAWASRNLAQIAQDGGQQARVGGRGHAGSADTQYGRTREWAATGYVASRYARARVAMVIEEPVTAERRGDGAASASGTAPGSTPRSNRPLSLDQTDLGDRMAVRMASRTHWRSVAAMGLGGRSGAGPHRVRRATAGIGTRAGVVASGGEGAVVRGPVLSLRGAVGWVTCP